MTTPATEAAPPAAPTTTQAAPAVQTTGANVPVPAAPVQAPAVVATPAAPSATEAPGTGVEPSWLSSRLDQAKRQERDRILKELGVTDPAQAKSLLDAAKAAEAAPK